MKAFLGELIGTMILVIIGCGTVAIAVLFGALNLYGVALFFGAGVTVAIYASRSMCPAHLNPAVSFAFMLRKALNFRRFFEFVGAQLIGAMLGAIVLLLIFNGFIEEYESANEIVRGSEGSYHSAAMFGEYFPNPGFESELQVSHYQAIFWEGIGTFFLMLSILYVQRIQEIIKIPAPVIIGLTVALLIILIAPYTQGGFNPARDFGPRIIAYFGGWEKAAFPEVSFGFLTVYILGPILGASLATLITKLRR
ncbi:MIP/aquaporin family protein [Parvicella tangerina]|uniref:Glycerol uptake facilitator protein n=1 Tax=Parvicella tangerina TaxID=2829795 RepID=A0A916NEN1_9FLAO|nr:MIP/aquaporin family protein [Parvicella tangerina]CAG5076629.1 Glycerol uptake facilitator protein [Parvicella tangerina]